jgi:NAD(P)-dependent dehydrogenase (short-subunit alcohol dehydrogenase family)
MSIQTFARAHREMTGAAMELDGAVMIITGAGSGIGAATARAAHAAGAHVVLAGRRFERLEAIADELTTRPPKRPALAVAADVTNAADVAHLVEHTLAIHSRVDVLVNNAAQGFYSPVFEADLDLYRTLLEVNLVAPLALMRAVVPSMRHQGHGVIVNVSSGSSLGAYPTTGAYASTKAALNQLTDVARAELAADGITVSVIYPYLTESDFNDNLHAGTPILAPAEAPQHSAEYVADELLDLICSGEKEKVLVPHARQ